MAEENSVEVITSDAFRNDTPPRQDAMHGMYVDGVAAIPDKLIQLGYIPEGDRSTWVSTVIRTDNEGTAKEVFLSVSRPEQTIKFKALKLFKEAPEHARIRLASLNLHAFNFQPSRNTSDWVSSKDLPFMVMKTNTMEDGTYTIEEIPNLNIGESIYRLVVTPHEDVNQARVALVALPVSMDGRGTLPGSPTGHSPGYPVVEVYVFSSVSMSGIQSPVRQDGFPFLPVLISTEAPHPVPDITSVKKALYAFWSTMMQPNVMTLEMWADETKGPAAPSQDQARTAYSWPQYQEQAPSDGDQSSDDETG